jgi:hypothetical protein|tara:strand:- start:2045 stop:3058 length:1014 start_codon:yes stop_codon:yes gene_type:complete
MFKRLDPSDVDRTPFKVYKEFTVTNEDSGSFVYNFRAVSGSHRGYDKTTDGVDTYQSASFFHLPAWFMLNHRYYRQKGSGLKRETSGNTALNPYNNFGSNSNKQYRLLHASASVISVPKDLYGERIKPKSITLKDDSTSSTVTMVDDGEGNLYDNSLSQSFATFASGGFLDSDIAKSTASFAGNVFYEEGVIVITNTGSKFIDVGTGEGSDGFDLEYKAQVTLNEYSYFCVIGENEFNTSTNISTTFQKSGSISVSGSDAWAFFPPGDAKYQSGSYKHFYEQATRYEPFVTHSEFRPYVTKVGLYNDFNELIAIGQLSAPIKNDKDLALGFVVRFDA